MDLLSWHNLIYYVSIAFGLVVGLASAFGGHSGDTEGDADTDTDTDTDTDVEHDMDSDADGDADNDADTEQDTSQTLEVMGQSAARRVTPGRLILRWLGIGKAPMVVLLMTACLIFGLVGIVINQLLARAMPHSEFGLLSVCISSVITVVLTRFIAGVIHRIMPTFETYSVKNRDLVGRIGMLILPADAKRGTAQVYDHEGNIHQIACRTDGPTIDKGTSILIVQYDANDDTYLVDSNPLVRKGER